MISKEGQDYIDELKRGVLYPDDYERGLKAMAIWADAKLKAQKEWYEKRQNLQPEAGGDSEQVSSEGDGAEHEDKGCCG